MFILKALFKGISAFGLILSLAISFAPPTDREAAALGPDYTRRDIVQMRIATGTLMMDRFGLLDQVAAMQDIPPRELRAVLRAVSEGRGPGLPAPQTEASSRGIDGPRFVTVN